MLCRGVCLGMVAGLALAGCSDSPTPESPDRLRAVRETVAAGDDKAAEQVGAMVRDPDRRVASQAIVMLGRMPSGRASEILKDVLATEQRPELRKWAAVSLGQRRDPQAADGLRRAVSRDRDADVRSQAALSLGRAGTVDDVAVLAQVAGAESDPQAIRAQVTAMESLIGVRFPYDAKASPQVRREQLERVRREAVRLMQIRKGQSPPDFKDATLP